MLNYNTRKRSIYFSCGGILLASFIVMLLTFSIEFSAIFLLGAIWCCIPILLKKGVKKGIASMMLVVIVYILIKLYNNNLRWDSIFGFVVYLPFLCYCVNNIQVALLAIKAEYEQSKKILDESRTIDENTQLKNIHAYQNDAYIYMKIADRYKIGLAIIIIELTNNSELLKYSTAEENTYLIQQISSTLRKSVRLEDICYKLDEQNPTWALMMLTKEDKVKNVLDRIKNIFTSINSTSYSDNKVVLDFKIEYITYKTDNHTSPNSMLNDAKYKLTNKNLGCNLL